jgi:hypothetical protein
MYFDVAMPITVFTVTFVSLFLNQRTESKLKLGLESREIATRDVVLLLATMVVMISFIVFIPHMALMILFLFSYSMLLFLFTYIFSNKRWYAAVLPPAVFILLYLFIRENPLWYLYLVNVYGVVFAVLITLYIETLFTWKTTAIFAILLTTIDIVLVLITGAMVSAANTTSSLKLPVLVTVQVLPMVEWGGKTVYMSLGLGDLFFAELLAIQTFKKYGRNLAFFSVISMSISFFIFEAYLLTYRPGAFPGTLMIICGWLPLVIWKILKR